MNQFPGSLARQRADAEKGLADRGFGKTSSRARERESKPRTNCDPHRPLGVVGTAPRPRRATREENGTSFCGREPGSPGLRQGRGGGDRESIARVSPPAECKRRIKEEGGFRSDRSDLCWVRMSRRGTGPGLAWPCLRLLLCSPTPSSKLLQRGDLALLGQPASQVAVVLLSAGALCRPRRNRSASRDTGQTESGSSVYWLPPPVAGARLHEDERTSRRWRRRN